MFLDGDPKIEIRLLQIGVGSYLRSRYKNYWCSSGNIYQIGVGSYTRNLNRNKNILSFGQTGKVSDRVSPWDAYVSKKFLIWWMLNVMVESNNQNKPYGVGIP